ncbi:hypothetical protein V8C86DRAFT_2477075 [Haematococcus lacustris]
MLTRPHGIRCTLPCAMLGWCWAQQSRWGLLQQHSCGVGAGVEGCSLTPLQCRQGCGAVGCSGWCCTRSCMLTGHARKWSIKAAMTSVNLVITSSQTTALASCIGSLAC